jgi:DNA-binding transcriptional MerR regulator/Lon protease-like protein
VAGVAGTDKKRWLSAAQCATRTGLTVRALRVYEREGLVSPVRSDKGWRRYGPAELERINTIRSLKALGLTLEQIRKVMADRAPPLLQILDMQIESLTHKRAAADRALKLLGAARRRAVSGPPSLEELCELIKATEQTRSTEMGSAIFRRMINKSTSADEERSYLTWWAEHPADAEASRGTTEQLRAVFADAEQLAEQNVPAASPAAQALSRRQLAVQQDSHPRTLRLMQWNPSIAARFLSIGAQAWLQHAAAEKQAPMTPRAAVYLEEARAASPLGQASRGLVLGVRSLIARHVDPASPDADAAVARLGEICQIHGLGDPYAYVQWLRVQARLFPAPYETAWAFLAQALESRGGGGTDLDHVKGWLEALAAAEAPSRVIERVPVIPLRDVVVYPGVMMPVFIRRPDSVQAAEAAMRADRHVMLLTQRRAQTDDPKTADLHAIGTYAAIQDMTVVDEAQGVQALTVNGVSRARVDRSHEETFLSADITLLGSALEADEGELEALRRSVITGFEQCSRIRGWPPELLPGAAGGWLAAFSAVTPLDTVVAYFTRMDSGQLADRVAGHHLLSLDQKQAVLEMLDVRQRLEYVDTALRNLAPAAP